MRRTIDTSPRDQESMPFWKRAIVKKTLAITAAVGSVLGASGCEGDNVSAVPAPPEQTTSGPQTPGVTETIPTSEAPTADPTETVSQTVDIEPYRDWNISPETLTNLEAASTDREKWDILKQVVVDNNEAGTYTPEVVADQLNTTPEQMFHHSMVELETMGNLAEDPTVANGLEIATVWANLAIIDEDYRAKFLDIASSTRQAYQNPESAVELRELAEKDPYYDFNTMLIASDSVQNFNDPATGNDYAGVTVTTLLDNSYKEYSNGSIYTFTVVLDGENGTTKILREYAEEIPGGWSIAWNVGEEPQPVRERPEVQAVLTTAA